MTPIRIEDLDDPRLQPYRVMSDAAMMREHGLFVAEGRMVVERVLRDTRLRVVSVLLSPPAVAALAPALGASSPAVTVFEIPSAGFEPLTGHDIHRGCLALVERPAPVSWRDVATRATTLVVLEGIANADNVGSIFRTAHALGVDGVLLDPACCDPLYRKAIRTSMGAVFQVPWSIAEPWPDVLQSMRASDCVVAALTPAAGSVPLSSFVATTSRSRVAFVVGTEGDGLTRAALESADARVRIPMMPGVDSLNVGVAAAVALSRRFEATHPPPV